MQCENLALFILMWKNLVFLIVVSDQMMLQTFIKLI